MYVTVSISTGLYPNLDLKKADKLHYITLHVLTMNNKQYVIKVLDFFHHMY